MNQSSFAKASKDDITNMSKHFDTNNKSREELAGSLAEFRVKLSQLEFERADKKLKDVSQFKKTKRDVARILTALSK